MLPNSLGDLTKRESICPLLAPAFLRAFRLTCHDGPAVPGNWPRENAVGRARYGCSSAYGDDVLLTNVLSFDVQVLIRKLPLKSNGVGGVVMTPMDPGYGQRLP